MSGYTIAQRKLFELASLVDGSKLRAALAEYEATGDHDHGNGPIAPGAPCPGRDCWVYKARKLLDHMRALEHLNGAAGDTFSGRRWGSFVALHKLKSERGADSVKLALVCDCGAYVESTIYQLNAGRRCLHEVTT